MDETWVPKLCSQLPRAKMNVNEASKHDYFEKENRKEKKAIYLTERSPIPQLDKEPNKTVCLWIFLIPGSRCSEKGRGNGFRLDCLQPLFRFFFRTQLVELKTFAMHERFNLVQRGSRSKKIPTVDRG